MPSRRYTIVLANRSTGVLRRFTISLRPVIVTFCALFALPVLMGLGARWSALAEIQQLMGANSSLSQENESYRAATAQLTDQISTLQSAINTLSEQTAVDPGTAKALKNLPSLQRARATGGEAGLSADPSVTSVSSASAMSLAAAAALSPEGTFGVLRDLLGVLESRLQIVRTGVERRQALANAMPSIWPARGWLSDTFGIRKDPFTGEKEFHPALDISADKGQPIFAAADGTVASAGRNGPYGNMVELRHGFGLATRYGHMSAFAVKRGATVRRGDVIGYVGSTGRSTGSHVHYEVWLDGRPVNPLQLLTAQTGK